MLSEKDIIEIVVAIAIVLLSLFVFYPALKEATGVSIFGL